MFSTLFTLEMAKNISRIFNLYFENDSLKQGNKRA